MKSRQILSLVGLLICGLLWITSNASAFDYPTRPISVIIPYAPGGSTDLGSKIISQKLSEFLGQPITSEYKTGASGAIGVTAASRAKPDGYTFVIAGQTALVILPLVKNLDYALDDFNIIFGYSVSPISIQVSANSPWNNLSEFIADAKKNPGKYSFGSPGVFHMGHFVMEYIIRKEGLKMTHVPFEGSEKVNMALLGNHIDIGAAATLGGLHKAGKLRPLAVAEKERFPTLQEVPTLTELGYPCQLNIQFAFCAPKNTPLEIVNKVNDAYNSVFKKYGKELEEYFVRVDQRFSNMSSKEANEKYQADYKTIYGLAKDMGVLVRK